MAFRFGFLCGTLRFKSEYFGKLFIIVDIWKLACRTVVSNFGYFVMKIELKRKFSKSEILVYLFSLPEQFRLCLHPFNKARQSSILTQNRNLLFLQALYLAFLVCVVNEK